MTGNSKQAVQLFPQANEYPAFRLQCGIRRDLQRRRDLLSWLLFKSLQEFTGRGPNALAVLEQSATHLEELLADDPYGVAFQRTVTVALYRLSQWREEKRTCVASN